MTEAQAKRVYKKLQTESYIFVGYCGENEDGWKVYETDDGELFAVSPDGKKVSFDVYKENDCFYGGE